MVHREEIVPIVTARADGLGFFADVGKSSLSEGIHVVGDRSHRQEVFGADDFEASWTYITATRT